MDRPSTCWASVGSRASGPPTCPFHWRVSFDSPPAPLPSPHPQNPRVPRASSDPSSDPTVKPPQLHPSLPAGGPSPDPASPPTAPAAALKGKTLPRPTWHLLSLETDNRLSRNPGPDCQTSKSQAGSGPAIRCSLALAPRAHVDPLGARTAPASLKPTS